VWDEAHEDRAFRAAGVLQGRAGRLRLLVPTPSRRSRRGRRERLRAAVRALREAAPRSIEHDTSGPIAAAAVAPVEVVEQKIVAGSTRRATRETNPKALCRGSSAPLPELAGDPDVARAVREERRVRQPRSSSRPRVDGQVGAHSSSPTRRCSRTASRRRRCGRPFRLTCSHRRRWKAARRSRVAGDRGYAREVTEDDERAFLDGVTPRAAKKAAGSRSSTEPRSVRGRDDLVLRPAACSRAYRRAQHAREH